MTVPFDVTEAVGSCGVCGCKAGDAVMTDSLDTFRPTRVLSSCSKRLYFGAVGPPSAGA